MAHVAGSRLHHELALRIQEQGGLRAANGMEQVVEQTLVGHG